MALGPKNPHGLEGSPLYDVLNVGKRNATFNLKDPRAVELVKKLMLEWADVVVENFAPRAMKGFGLDYESIAPDKPSLVMVSACLNGQTGPHKDYPGFGSQGSALSGFTDLTGWPDRAPVGPSGTITDSLAPRYVATAVAAGLHYARRTGRGVYLDLAQVEAGIYTLSPWLLEADADGVIEERAGNRSSRAVPHGGFACADETLADGGVSTDRWVAIACWTDARRDHRRRRLVAREARRAARAHRRRGGRGHRVDVAALATRRRRAAAGRGDRSGAGGGLRRHPRRSAGRAPSSLRAPQARGDGPA
jgi:benzylsuccinate CoA-transferase BbsF subunit